MSYQGNGFCWLLLCDNLSSTRVPRAITISGPNHFRPSSLNSRTLLSITNWYFRKYHSFNAWINCRIDIDVSAWPFCMGGHSPNGLWMNRSPLIVQHMGISQMIIPYPRHPSRFVLLSMLVWTGRRPKRKWHSWPNCDSTCSSAIASWECPGQHWPNSRRPSRCPVHWIGHWAWPVLLDRKGVIVRLPHEMAIVDALRHILRIIESVFSWICSLSLSLSQKMGAKNGRNPNRPPENTCKCRTLTTKWMELTRRLVSLTLSVSVGIHPSIHALAIIENNDSNDGNQQ